MVFDIPAVAAPWKGAQGAQGLRERRGVGSTLVRPFDRLRDRGGRERPFDPSTGSGTAGAEGCFARFALLGRWFDVGSM